MAEILFLAPFPNEYNIKDGMIQRIKHIDDLFSSTERKYLDISFSKNLKGHISKPYQNVSEYNFNFFVHFFKIWKLILNSERIYVHSIYRLLAIILPICFYKNILCLDVHGVVPEENKMTNGFLLYKVYSLIEHFAFHKITHVVFVTKAMQKHYSTKFNVKNIKSIVFNIYPNLSNRTLANNNENSKTVVIYSGNAQAWQNVDGMLELIFENYNENFEYIILTGQPDVFNDLLKKRNGLRDNVLVKSVSPSELEDFYIKANYGIILRDDILVNRVANPTKMIEYLMFGIVPIVRLKEIGDFFDMGYEYVEELNFSKNLKPVKSLKNKQIAQKICSDNKTIEMNNFLSNDKI